MQALNRVVGGVSRRLGRPELLAAVSRTAREAQEETLGMAVVLATTLHRDGVYVDVGTNRGQVLAEAVRVAPGARHIAFEPIPALAAEVARAFPDVDVRRKAVGGEVGRAEFCHFRRQPGWSGLRRQPGISDERGEPEYIDVEVSTLDVELDGIDPSVVKIDVEGAEQAVLEGGRAVLERARPVVLFEHVYEAAAVYGVAPGAPWALLDELGYTVFTATGSGPVSRSQFEAALGVVNWLARPDAA